MESIALGGGCFWCLEAVYLRAKGVREVVSGYAGGENLPDGGPSYEQVSSGKTGHAEVVKVVFDPREISLEDILHIFFVVHDPTTYNRQGNDIGSQYRSIVLYENKAQHEVADGILRETALSGVYDGPLVTELKELEKFYPAEDYHQRYFEKNPEQAYCQLVISSKVAKFRDKYGRFFKE
jgi:peptide-methionine (S)-S-oxide reductase